MQNNLIGVIFRQEVQGMDGSLLIREQVEQREAEYLSEYAALSSKSRGRAKPEAECDIRPVYQRDRDRILHSKAFRRLKDKTQVFLTPNGDHYRTRLTHTLEVSQNARTIAKALKMNEDLVEAIALGHDLGHTPFGHAGERALSEVCSKPFIHSEQSVRVVEFVEKDGCGLNLTFEVIDGIRNHQSDGNPITLEGKIVRLSDKMAYIHHDMDDAIRGGILTEEDLPKEITDVLGKTLKERLNHLIHDIVTQSINKNDIVMSEEVHTAMMNLRKFMFYEVYNNKVVKAEEQKAEQLVIRLFEYYMKRIDKLPREVLVHLDFGQTKEQLVCDYIASMSDKFAIKTFEALNIPKSWEY